MAILRGFGGCVSLLFVGAKINKLCHLAVCKFKNTALNGDVTRDLASLLRNLVVCNPYLKGGENVISEDKTRISLYFDKEFVKIIDENIKKYGFSSRSDFFRIAGENLVADRNLQENATAISRRLSYEISKNGKENSKRISQGFFRYAVQMEMIMRVIAKSLGNSDFDIDKIRKDSIRNVYLTKGRVNMEEILKDYDYKKKSQDEFDDEEFIFDDEDFIFDDEYDY